MQITLLGMYYIYIENVIDSFLHSWFFFYSNELSYRNLPYSQDYDTFAPVLSQFDHPSLPAPVAIPNSDHPTSATSAAVAAAAAAVAPSTAPSSTIDRNNKLLSFSLPIYNFALLDYSLRRASPSVSAQLHGMFFLAESPWTMSPDENAPPQQGAELTCYRRNLFQISGSITVPRGLRYIMTDQGDRIPILAQELTVSATESVEGNSVKIISVPWKTANATGQDDSAAGSGASNNSKVEREPPPIPLDTMAGQDLDSDYATFPISWKRLQFRVATANNGRRKELQQHFVVHLQVIATLSTGDKIPICEVNSGPVIVRGRSPRNFQSRKDLPLSNSAASSRKNVQQAVAAASAATSTSIAPTSAAANATRPTSSSLSPPLLSSSGAKPGPKLGAKRASPTLSTGHGSRRSPDGSSASPSTSLSLSLTGENRGGSLKEEKPRIIPKQANPKPVPSQGKDTQSKWDYTTPPTKMRKLSHGLSSQWPSNLSVLGAAAFQPSSFSGGPLILSNENNYGNTNNNSNDLLYEYFPLALDEWQPPVDAVYRPHLVHHVDVPDMKFAPRGRNKRYFTEDVF